MIERESQISLEPSEHYTRGAFNDSQGVFFFRANHTYGRKKKECSSIAGKHLNCVKLLFVGTHLCSFYLLIKLNVILIAAEVLKMLKHIRNSDRFF